MLSLPSYPYKFSGKGLSSAEAIISEREREREHSICDGSEQVHSQLGPGLRSEYYRELNPLVHT